MTDHVAPQEDQMKLPAAWAAKLLPWRGRRDGKAFEPADAEAVEGRRQYIADRDAKLRMALAKPENEGYADAGLAYLDGKSDPLGAAVVAALVLDQDHLLSQPWMRPDFDLWLHDHGPVFAAVAAFEYLAVIATTDGYYGGALIANRVLIEHQLEHPYMAQRELPHGGIAAVRSVLASASDAEYAEIVAAVAGRRDTGARRMVAMLLFPGEHDWVRETCAEYLQARNYDSGDRLLFHSISRPAQAAALLGVSDYRWIAHIDIETVAALLGGLGTEALPFLIKLANNAAGFESIKLIHRGIGAVPSDEAMAFLLEGLDRPFLFDAAVEAAGNYPVRALRTAARLAPTAPPERRRWIAAVANTVDPGHHAHLSEAERALLDDLLADVGRVPAAALEDLPPLLVAPPWTRKRRKAKAVVIENLEAPAQSHLRWAEGERESWSRVRGFYELDETYWSDEPTVEPDDWRLVSFIAFAEIERAEPLLGHWDGGANIGWHTDLQRILARYGDRVIDRVLKLPATDHTCHVLPGPVLNLAAARIAAERLARLKAARAGAIRWFERHGLDAVPYLVPDALGADKKRRKYAEFALAHLAVRHGAEAVAAQAESFGSEAAEAITALLGADPLEPIVKVPKPGFWATPFVLPQVLLKGGERALPAEAVPHLITVLALGSPDYPYPGIEVVAGACDRASLTRFGRALFDQWLAVGAPAKDSWALTQLANFADDATVWRLASLIREWPGENQHKRAVTGLEVLGAIGTEEAMRAIQHIADKVKFNGLKKEAGRQITFIAESLGLSREQLADRLVPDFGLGDDSALVLDYGPRKFTVVFDERLNPCVTDEDGKLRKALPKPGVKDDPEIAEDAYQRFAALKKELRTVAADQVRRVEDAMVSTRDWSVDEFHRFFAEHPLTKHLARRLVWLAETDGDRFGFRIAEDGTFSDVEDDAVELPETARIRVAHPVHLGADRTAVWAEVFADYEILQPFDQLNRPVMAFTEDELATGRLARFEGAKVDVGRVLGLTKRGWNRAEPEDGGMAPGVAYPLTGGGCIVVALDPGIYVGMVGEFPEQKLDSVRIALYERYQWSEKDDVDREFPTDIDPVTASEILASLARLTGAA
jgi:hypothetical protein